MNLSQHETLEPLQLIGQVAAEHGLHPQTLRQYERLGLIRPCRTRGNTRRYSRRDRRRIGRIVELTHEHGVNLAGVAIILELELRLRRLQPHAHGVARR
jgi:MerR family transcriptional regulator/heat shock protein HspR